MRPQTDDDIDRISRLPAVAAPADDSAIRALFNMVHDRGGKVLNLHRVVAHSPTAAAALIALAHALRFSTALPRPLAELIIIRTAQIVGSDYELAQHLPMALGCGVSQSRIDALNQWRAHALFTAPECAALAYAEQVAGGGDVEDQVFANLEKWFTPGEIVELTLTVAFYFATGLLLKSLMVEAESV